MKLFKKDSCLISLIEPFKQDGLIEKMAAQGVNVFGLEVIPRTSRAQAMDVLSSQANIAGAREADYWAGVPGVYAGCAGIDCSGLVSRLVGITDINKKWGVQNGDISYYCMQKNAAKIEPGDLLVYKTYKHVVICGDGDPNSQLTIYQATPNKYSDGEHVRRVVCESVSSRVVEEKV